MSQSNRLAPATGLPPRGGTVLPYVIAFVGIVLATVITRNVHILQQIGSTAMYFIVVILAAYKGGIKPAIFAVGLSALMWALLVIPPDYSFDINSPADTVRLVLFICVAVLTSSLFEQLARARRELRKQQARLDLALEAGRMGVWDYDLIQDEFWISPEVRELFGVKADGEFSPTYGGFLAFVHPDDRAAVVRAMTTSRENRSDYQLEHRLIRRDKAIRWIATRGRTFCDADGRAERMIGLVVDVTEFREEEMPTASSPSSDAPSLLATEDASERAAAAAASAKVAGGSGARTVGEKPDANVSHPAGGSVRFA
jgi:PAS domain-containing protein